VGGQPTSRAEAARSLHRAARAALIGVGAVAGWILADLYLRVDLPGAAWLTHQLFRALVGPLEWLTEGEEARLYALVLAWLGLAAVSLVVRGVGRGFWAGTALLVTALQLLVVAMAALMERALAGGLAVALVVAWRLDALGWDAGDGDPGPWVRRAWIAAAAIAAAVAVYYVYAMFMTYGEGYALLRWAGDRVRGEDLQLLVPYAVAIALLQMAAGLALVRRPGGRRAQRLAPAATAGIAVAVALELLFGQRAALWPFVLVVPAGLLAVSLAWPVLVLGPLRRGWQPTALPRMMLPFAGLALVLMGHTYAGRVFRCPDAGAIPGLTRLATPAEVFRVTLARDGTVAALTLRTSCRLAALPLEPEPGDLAPTASGPAGSPGPDDPDGRITLNGVPEELVYAPALDRFFATLSPHDYDALTVDLDVDYGGREARLDELTNVLLTVSGDGRRVIEAVGVPGLCWINTLRWSEPEQLLYIGCEDRAGVHRYDPVARAFSDGNTDPTIGDVQKIALDHAGDRLFTVSLWKRPTVTELDLATLQPRRQTVIGGSHYDVVHDPGSDRVFASAFYGSRVRVVNAATLERESTIPGGFGTRALAVADDLLLVSSVYDGLLRACDPASGDVLHRLPVGGHVKDIAVDPERDLAYLWSQCGLYRLDLATLR